MAVAPDEFILFAAIIGLLIGIIWGLKYIVKLERRIEALDKTIRKAVAPARKRKR